MRLAVFTPRPRSPWWGPVLERLARACEVVQVDGDDPLPSADVHVYDVADEPAHAFVLRALRRRPGLVVLESWSLHRLVHAEAADRGDASAYRREARLSHGESGSFVAEQVLAGRGGSLASLLPWNETVLAASLALATPSEAVRARAAERLGERSVVGVSADDADAAASVLLSVARVVARDGERLLRAAREDRAPAATLLGLALDELRPAALALGLTAVPADVRDLCAALLPEEP